MRSVAEQFNGLKMSVEKGRPGRIGVDEDSRCAMLQNPVRLAESTVEVAPVMRRVAAREKIETAVFERQILCRSFHSLDIVEAFVACGPGDSSYHFWR